MKKLFHLIIILGAVIGVNAMKTDNSIRNQSNTILSASTSDTIPPVDTSHRKDKMLKNKTWKNNSDSIY